MKNKNNIYSMSKALKIYNITSIPKTTAYLCIFNLLTYFILTLIIHTSAESQSELQNLLMIVILSTTPLLMLSNLFSKVMQGNKYIRSLPNDFEIFKKAKYAITLSVILSQIIFSMIICTVNIIKPSMDYGIQSCISITLFSLVGSGVLIIFQIFKNTAAQLIAFFILLLFSFSGFIVVPLNDGKLGIIQIAAGITAVILIPLSTKIMLNDYKKKYWKN